ncbi:MAG TPA: hypothetical protein VFX89_01770 [Gammaproteobacteria bacterium]|nr:hypothetical protein [Gammaproteobacteria bacterium]
MRKRIVLEAVEMRDDAKTESPGLDRTKAVAFLTDHPGVWVPGLYMIGSTIGMLDSWWFFHQFGINVFLYSDAADFLLASFRNPVGWLVMGCSAIIGIGDYSNSLRFAHSGSTRRWLRWYGSRRYRQTGWIFGVVLAVAYIAFFAGGRADGIYHGRSGKSVRVTLTSGPAAEKTAVLLGSTVSFLFLYDRGAGTVSIHPYENVLTVDSDVPGRAND